MPTVRERIGAIQADLVNTPDLAPSVTASHANELAGLYGHVLAEVRRTEMDWNRRVQEYIAAGDPVTKAERKANALPEYERKLEAEHVEKQTLQMLRTLKTTMEMQIAEMRLAR